MWLKTCRPLAGKLASMLRLREGTDLVRQWWLFANGQLPPPVQVACATWMSVRDERMAFLALILALGFHGGALFVDRWLVDSALELAIVRIGHLGTWVVSLGVLALVGIRGRRMLRTYLAAYAVSLAPFVYLVASSVRRDGDTTSLATARYWATYICLGFFHVLLLPSHSSRLPVVLSAGLLGIGGWCWWGSPFFTVQVSMAVWLFVTVAAYQIGQTIHAFDEGRKEYAGKVALARSEQAVLDRDLDVARGIHNSLITPEQIRYGSLDIDCFQRRHRKVGGDWVAIRRGGDELFIVMAAAAGKGISAALVMHAVHALWAETLEDAQFDPVAWMGRVNLSLDVLGAKQDHMVTMGILGLTPAGKATYWSVGYLPVFLIRGERVQRIISRGNPLGISADLQVEPVSFELGEAPWLIFGSDGVFDRRITYGNRQILALQRGLHERGRASLEALPVVDDQTLVWIRRGSDPSSGPETGSTDLRQAA